MIGLWLKYQDSEGNEMRVSVDKERFAIGRHSANDLSIADGRLSREHALIERFGDIFVLSDRGSSNGTELNEERLSQPAAIKSGDRVSLGGFPLEIEFENKDSADGPAAAPEPAAAMPVPPAAEAAEPVGIPKSFFFIAPVFAFVVLVVIVIVIYLAGGGSRTGGNSNFVYSDDPDGPPKNRREKNANSGNSTSSSSNDLVTASPTPGVTADNTATPTGTNLTDTSKTEQNAAAFLRRAAQNDPRAFITGEQAQAVNSKIKSLGGLPSLADNINSARKSSAQIKALAATKNLKPQFLAVAAITKLGGSRGDVLQTAQSIVDVLEKLDRQIGSEMGDDCLLMMAAFDQGTAGDFMKMRNMLQALAVKTPESSRAIRTIWFLKKNGKITDAEFDLSLRFLAIGTVSQNPKDYGVNAEALAL
jgi:hypothetical protein